MFLLPIQKIVNTITNLCNSNSSNNVTKRKVCIQNSKRKRIKYLEMLNVNQGKQLRFRPLVTPPVRKRKMIRS